MKYEDIEVDKRYLIDYLDPNYPCDCKCHDFPDKIQHTKPCCHDDSYQGLATCIKKHNDTKLIEFLIDKKVDGDWCLCIFAEDVLDKL